MNKPQTFEVSDVYTLGFLFESQDKDLNIIGQKMVNLIFRGCNLYEIDGDLHVKYSELASFLPDAGFGLDWLARLNFGDDFPIVQVFNYVGVLFPKKNTKPVIQSKCYLMLDKNTGLTKIGKSKNPRFREKTLQSAKPTIELLHVFDTNIESKLHKKFAHKRVRGEWFLLSKKEIDSIVKEHSPKRNGTE